MRKIFVTNELSPFTTGGIGRVIHNILKTMNDRDRELTTLIVVDCKLDTIKFSNLFSGVTLICVNTEMEDKFLPDYPLYPPQQAFTQNKWLWKSQFILRTLLNISNISSVGYVEFPDWGALAFATLQEKLVSGFLDNANIAVRLHTSHAVLCVEQGHDYGQDDRVLADMERKCLRDCDLLISQNIAATDRMRDIFGLAEQDWNARIVKHAPPVVLYGETSSVHSIIPHLHTPIVFGSKMQKVKNPKLFVRGVCGFLVGTPQYGGTITFAAHSLFSGYDASVVSTIPNGLQPRFSWLGKNAETREEIISRGIFVMTSAFESFCLAAFEASLMGAVVILNGINPAFGPKSPWIDGRNCIKFDGTALDLTTALERAFALSAALEIVRPDEDPFPWAGVPVPQPWADSSDTPLVSIIIPHFNLGSYVLDTIQNCLEQTYRNIEIILIDDCSTDIESLKIIESINKDYFDSADIKIFNLPCNIGLSAARNFGIKKANGKYIFTIDADDLAHPSYIKKSVRCMEEFSDIGFVVTHARYFTNGTNHMNFEIINNSTYHLFVGEALLSGIFQNNLSTSCCMFRKDIFIENNYIEDLECYEDWSLYLILIYSKIRCAVTNECFFYYRKRENSMIKKSNNIIMNRIYMKEMYRVSFNIYKSFPLQFMLFGDEINLIYPQQNLQMHNQMIGNLQDALVKKNLLLELFITKSELNKSNLFDQIDVLNFFDAQWYLENNPDVQKDGIDPLKHFSLHGLYEGRSPNSYFIPENYLVKNPDVKTAGMLAVEHYILFGIREGRIF